MQRNVKLIIGYDGTAYLGWQKTKMGQSIEGTLQSVLEKILQHPVTLQAASRTDAGVHADAQVINFFTTKDISEEKLFTGLNSLLPKDIVIWRISEAPTNFHPTLDVVEKEYHYHICSAQVQHPAKRLYSWHYPYSIDLSLMRKAANLLVGTHDFASFCNTKKQMRYKDTIRTVTSIDIQELEENRLKIVVRGQNFLFRMVRNIVGTLVYISHNKLSIDTLPLILSCCDRTQAGVTAPQHGLTLHKVFYSKDP